ncbi:MAG TPA: TAXI family TRAP transporter solute-binding subunit [Candidatus Acidoferrum sp.]
MIASLGVLAFTVLAIWLAFAILRPTPPRSVAMSTGPVGSFNVELGKRYQEFFARGGVHLKLVPSAGAVENVSLLRDPKSGIDIAIVPGGITSQQESPNLVSLGTLFYEPLWLFSPVDSLEKRDKNQGLRIAVGPEGSGTHKLSVEFLERAGIIDQKSATLLPFTPQESANKLVHGEIDAAVVLDAWKSPVVQEFFAIKNLRLTSIRRADAFVALYPALNKLVLPAGVADMIENRPPTDVLLLAPKASLVVRRDLHPVIQYLLLEAATEIHSEPDVFRAEGQFPAAESNGFLLSSYARQFYKTGSPFLQRHLPLWLAVLVQQLLVLLIPVLGFVYPLLRFSPLIYSWVRRRRVYRLYSELKSLEEGLATARMSDRENFVEQLDQLEDRASRLSLPMSFRPLQYALRSHIDVVRHGVRNLNHP